MLKRDKMNESDEGIIYPRKNYSLKQGHFYRVLFDGTILTENGVEEG
jgi:hypothetical protein